MGQFYCFGYGRLGFPDIFYEIHPLTCKKEMIGPDLPVLKRQKQYDNREGDEQKRKQGKPPFSPLFLRSESFDRKPDGMDQPGEEYDRERDLKKGIEPQQAEPHRKSSRIYENDFFHVLSLSEKKHHLLPDSDFKYSIKT